MLNYFIMYTDVEVFCINNINNSYYSKMADKIHSESHVEEHSDSDIECSQPIIKKKKVQKIVDSESESDDIDGIAYKVTLDVFFKTCLLIFATPFDFQRQLMFTLPNIKRDLKTEPKPFRQIVFAMIKAVHQLYTPKMNEYVGWESFFQKLTESSWSNVLYDGTLMPNVKAFFEKFVKTQLDSVDSVLSSSTTQNKTSSTSTSYTIATKPVENADAPLCLDSILYDIPAPSTNNSLGNQERIYTMSDIMRVRTSDGLNSYELKDQTGDYYVTMRIIPASVVMNPQIQSSQYWKHAKQELRFSVKERSTDPVSRSTFQMIQQVTNKIVNCPESIQTYRPFSNWNNF